MEILCVLSRYPWPLEKGDKLRAYHFVRCMAQKHDVHLVALSQCSPEKVDFEELKPFCKSITVIRHRWWHTIYGLSWALFKRKPFQVGYFYSPGLRKKVRNAASSVKPDAIFAQLIRVVPLIDKLPYKKIIDYQDSFSMNMERRATNNRGITKLLFLREARAVRRYENRVFGFFDHHIIIAEPDKEAIDHPEKEKIEIVANGVDFNYFSPAKEHTGENVVLFTGNMGYPPNIEGALWLAREIMPIVRKKIPDATLMVAGANPAPAVRSLHSGNTIVTGWLDDIRDAYSGANVFVAPMKSGSGLQNKLLEAMCMNLPCVTTPLANASLGAKENTEILVAEKTEDVAEHIVKLLESKEYAGNIAEAGMSFVKHNFNWQKIIETFMTKAGL